MTMIADRLVKAGIELPDATAPVANYVAFVTTGRLIMVSGQLSMADGTVTQGRLGDRLSIEDGQVAARQCAVNILAQLDAACRMRGETLDSIARIVRLGVFVTSTPDFSDQAKVANGASDLMVEIFSEKGRHARAAVGVPCLPLGAAVEIDAIAEFV